LDFPPKEPSRTISAPAIMAPASKIAPPPTQADAFDLTGGVGGVGLAPVGWTDPSTIGARHLGQAERLGSLSDLSLSRAEQLGQRIEIDCIG
jgi:hypothetical protein